MIINISHTNLLWLPVYFSGIYNRFSNNRIWPCLPLPPSQTKNQSTPIIHVLLLIYLNQGRISSFLISTYEITATNRISRTLLYTRNMANISKYLVRRIDFCYKNCFFRILLQRGTSRFHDNKPRYQPQKRLFGIISLSYLLYDSIIPSYHYPW